MASTIQVDTIKDIGGNTIISSNGSGTFTSNLPASGATLTGSTNNTVTTVTGANAIQGEANLRFDGTSLAVGNTNFASFDADAKNVVIGTGSGDNGLTVYSDGSSSGSIFFANGTSGTQTKQGQIVYEQNNSTMLLKTASTTAMSIDGAGIITKPLQPAFQAYLASDQAVSATSATVTMNTEAFDANGDFNIGTYTFTAPITGKYILTTGVSNYGAANSGDYTAVRIVTSNSNYQDIHYEADQSSSRIGAHQVAVVADMDTNDTAYITIFTQNDSSFTVRGTRENTFFSGSLLG
jgi:hypothetical protein